MKEQQLLPVFRMGHGPEALGELAHEPGGSSCMGTLTSPLFSPSSLLLSHSHQPSSLFLFLFILGLAQTSLPAFLVPHLCEPSGAEKQGLGLYLTFLPMVLAEPPLPSLELYFPRASKALPALMGAGGSPSAQPVLWRSSAACVRRHFV